MGALSSPRHRVRAAPPCFHVLSLGWEVWGVGCGVRRLCLSPSGFGLWFRGFGFQGSGLGFAHLALAFGDEGGDDFSD